MKVPSSLFTISAVALCVTVAAAFTVGPKGNGLIFATPIKRSQQQFVVTSLRMSSEDFAKSEIDSNDVSVKKAELSPSP